MKYKATVSFAGEITMGRGEVRDVSDDIAAPLVADGYLEPMKDRCFILHDRLLLS